MPLLRDGNELPWLTTNSNNIST